MKINFGVVGLYVRDQDEALQFYVETLGFRVHTDPLRARLQRRSH